VPGWEFDRLLPLLERASLRVVVPDLFGHGYSDRPRAAYTHELFVRQLLELLDTLGLTGPVDVMGHSLGAALGARLACRIPTRVGRVILAAPLLRFERAGTLLAAVKCPVIGELLMPTVVLPLLVRRRTRRYRRIEDGRFVRKFREQLLKPHFGRALLSLVRQGSLDDQGDCYRNLAESHRRVLMLRGSADDIATQAQAREILALAPSLAYRELARLPHAFILTDPEAVALEVLDFLQAP
jgi:pimeloyl-ACP methyl ester carboxylesterase